MSTIKLTIRCPNGSKYQVETEPEHTIAEFKKAIEKETEIPAEEQRVIYKGRVLKDHATVESYEIADGHTVHLVRSRGQGSGPSPSSPSPSTQSTPAPSTNTGPQNTTPMPNPFAFGGMGGGAPNIDQMRQQMMQNPEMMQNLMNSPMMESMFSNPELMQNLINNDPTLRNMVERNPQLRQALTDPSILRQSLEMARNPAAFQEMMRQQDLAMSRLESHPQGMQMLNQLFGDGTNDIGGSNNTTPTTDTDTTTGSTGSTGSTGGGNSGMGSNPLPNPWNSRRSTNTTTNTNPLQFGGLGTTPPPMSTMPNMPNPALLADPEVQRHIQQMITSMRFLQDRGVLPPNTIPPNMTSMLDMMNGVGGGGMGGGGFGGGNPFLSTGFNPSTTTATTPTYDTQVDSLVNMGFEDREQNRMALRRVNGNVNRAVEILLENPPVVPTASSRSSSETAGQEEGSTERAQEEQEEKDDQEDQEDQHEEEEG